MPTSRTTRRTGRYATTNRRRTNSRTTSRGSASNQTYAPTKFNKHNKCVKGFIGSYRNLQTQWTGNGPVTAFSPTNANRWIKYINSGSYVYKFTNQQFCRRFGNGWISNPPSPTAAQRWLKGKYGAGIKNVTRGKGGCWLIAASSNISSGPFGNYKW
jgi:hypothetical protein